MNMTQQEHIRRIADFLFRNANTVNLTGLYNGKAGLSLSLFVASHFLQDENMGDTAFNLIQESMVIKNNDYSFENGVPGIGYALLYLIENNYFDANFDEVFGRQYKEIINVFEHIDKNPAMLVNHLTVIYFLSKVAQIKADKRIRIIMKKIFEGLELFLTVQFYDFVDFHYIGMKMDVLNIFKTYLKLVDYSGYTDFSRMVLNDYADLYRKGKVMSSFETGFYLNSIAGKHFLTGMEDVINDNMNHGLTNIYPFTLSVKDRIDLSKLVQHLGLDPFSICKNLNSDRAIKEFLKTVDEKSNALGYGAGLGRLLIYSVNKDIELL